MQFSDHQIFKTQGNSYNGNTLQASVQRKGISEEFYLFGNKPSPENTKKYTF